MAGTSFLHRPAGRQRPTAGLLAGATDFFDSVGTTNAAELARASGALERAPSFTLIPHSVSFFGKMATSLAILESQIPGQCGTETA